jgi:hypothetical protein
MCLHALISLLYNCTTASRFLALQMLQPSAALAASWALTSMHQTAQQLEVIHHDYHTVLMHATAMHCYLSTLQC